MKTYEKGASSGGAVLYLHLGSIDTVLTRRRVKGGRYSKGACVQRISMVNTLASQEAEGETRQNRRNRTNEFLLLCLFLRAVCCRRRYE